MATRQNWSGEYVRFNGAGSALRPVWDDNLSLAVAGGVANLLAVDIGTPAAANPFVPALRVILPIAALLQPVSITTGNPPGNAPAQTAVYAPARVTAEPIAPVVQTVSITDGVPTPVGPSLSVRVTAPGLPDLQPVTIRTGGPDVVQQQVYPSLVIKPLEPSKQRLREVQFRTGRPLAAATPWAVISVPVGGVQANPVVTQLVQITTGNPPGNPPVVAGQDFVPRTQVIAPLAQAVQRVEIRRGVFIFYPNVPVLRSTTPVAAVVPEARIRQGLPPGNVVFSSWVPVTSPLLPVATPAQAVAQRLGLTPGNVVVVVTYAGKGRSFTYDKRIGRAVTYDDVIGREVITSKIIGRAVTYDKRVGRAFTYDKRIGRDTGLTP